MTNEIMLGLQKIAKVLLFMFLLFVAVAVFNTFQKFSRLEKDLRSPDFDLAKDSANLKTGSEGPVQGLASQESLVMGDGSNYSLGTSRPKITIVEFADFACPYCRKSFSKIREISVLHNQDVKYIFRDLPIVKDYSASLALAARCAGEQGLFWLMHDRLFMEQGIKTKAEIMEAAKKSGVDMEKFQSCFDSQKYLSAIKKDYADAVALGLEKIGTPVWYINGQQISGDIPEDTFKRIIETTINQ